MNACAAPEGRQESPAICYTTRSPSGDASEQKSLWQSSVCPPAPMSVLAASIAALSGCAHVLVQHSRWNALACHTVRCRGAPKSMHAPASLQKQWNVVSTAHSQQCVWLPHHLCFRGATNLATDTMSWNVVSTARSQQCVGLPHHLCFRGATDKATNTISWGWLTTWSAYHCSTTLP